MITASESEILIAIAQAGAEGGNWPPVLRLLAAHLQADTAQLFTPAQSWDQSGACSMAVPDVLSALRLGRVYTGAELEDRDAAFGNAAADHRAIAFQLAQGVGWLVVQRSRGEFRAMDSAALAVLAVHLQGAFKIAAKITDLTQRATQAEVLARRMGVGCVTFDARGQPQACDPVAADLLGQMQHAPTLPRDMGQTALLVLSPDLDLLCQRAPDGRVTGVLRTTRQPLPPPEDIAKALHLTRSEARLARALALGASLSEAAQALDLTQQTARYYSKQIYAKTGLRGQPDLIRRIWTSALALG